MDPHVDLQMIATDEGSGALLAGVQPLGDRRLLNQLSTSDNWQEPGCPQHQCFKAEKETHTITMTYLLQREAQLSHLEEVLSV